MKNYIELGRKLPSRYRHFAFCDNTDCAALSLFYRYRVRIKTRQVAAITGGKYQIVFCDVRRKEVPLFIRAMEELKDKMLLIGNLDYEAFCDECMSLAEEN